METYTAMRNFADSWGLLCMALFFVGALLFAFRPGSRSRATRPLAFRSRTIDYEPETDRRIFRRLHDRP
jgi:cytochrome c oxidase cbb3-type subunit 4